MNDPHTGSDRHWMRYALALAARGLGSVEPNPMVGCAIVRDGALIGQGFHQRFGGLHAEREAIASLLPDVDASGATWYVTLEPCCHTGKTPPCTDAVIAARPDRVVVAAVDPFAEVSGRGIARLREAGIQVDLGIGEDEANRLNAAYRKRVITRRPWVIAKWAMTLDGKIASRTGNSQWITGAESRRRVHDLRGRVDAIITGMGTVRCDDPMLTARPPGPRLATRIVLDRNAELPLTSKLVKTAVAVPVAVCCSPQAPLDAVTELRNAGVQILPLASPNRTETVERLLDWCYQQGMTNVMLEAGSQVIGSWLEANAIDEFHVYVAAKVIGGSDAIGPAGGFGLAAIADSPLLEPLQAEAIDGDVLLTTRRCGDDFR